jgi:hypothetical protein
MRPAKRVQRARGSLKISSARFSDRRSLIGRSRSEAQEPLIAETVGPEGTVALMFDVDEAGWKGRMPSHVSHAGCTSR